MGVGPLQVAFDGVLQGVAAEIYRAAIRRISAVHRQRATGPHSIPARRAMGEDQRYGQWAIRRSSHARRLVLRGLRQGRVWERVAGCRRCPMGVLNYHLGDFHSGLAACAATIASTHRTPAILDPCTAELSSPGRVGLRGHCADGDGSVETRQCRTDRSSSRTVILMAINYGAVSGPQARWSVCVQRRGRRS